MRVLWVCNIMLPRIAGQLGVESSNKEGWLSGLSDILLERHQENGIELHVAYPVAKVEGGAAYDFHRLSLPKLGEGTELFAYGFYEDTAHAEVYDPALEMSMAQIIRHAQPDVIHCFGTEFAHTLAVVRCCGQPERILIGIQGLCAVIAGAYMADLPKRVQNTITLRDWLKKDSIREQQQKFEKRGEREREILQRAGNITGRTQFDRDYTRSCNPQARYFPMNETLRSCFYEGEWSRECCEPHTIFLSQGDYPLKGLHYLIMAAGELKEKYPDIRLKIAGNSIVKYKRLKDRLKISAYGSYLRRLMKQYGMLDRVDFLGRLTAEEMKTEYLSSGLFVCCSSNENSPNSLGEAMLLGVPCVAARVGGISSIFSGGKDGILYEGYERYDSNRRYLEKKDVDVEKKSAEMLEENDRNADLRRNVENLRNAIIQMWENPAEMETYCKNARKNARKIHDKEANYQKMTEIYAEISKCFLTE